MVRSTASFFALCFASLVFTGCSTAPKSEVGKSDLIQEARMAVAQAQRNDPSLAKLLEKAAGYAVFPSVGSGAAGIGGAYGKGILFEGGTPVGYCDLSQGSIGVQLGGQSYTEIIAFETPDAMNRFKSGYLVFAAQASAVAIKSGAGTNADYQEGVAVFTMDESGLMFQASLGGQQFTYQVKV